MEKVDHKYSIQNLVDSIKTMVDAKQPGLDIQNLERKRLHYQVDNEKITAIENVTTMILKHAS